MEQSIQDALQTLYGTSVDPVCAVDDRFDVVWQPDNRADALLCQLKLQLRCDAQRKLILPADHVMILEQTDPPSVCRMQQLPQCILLIFSALPAKRQMSVPEMRALLGSMSIAAEDAAMGVLQSVNSLVRNPSPEELHLHELRVRDACYALRNSSARSNELLWYESSDPVQCSLIPVQDLAGYVRQFLTDLRRAVNGVIRIEPAEIEDGLLARMDGKRLHFALLCMFVLAQGGAPDRTVLSCTARRIQTEIQISMLLHGGTADSETSPMLCTPADDGTLISERAILARFCEMFSAQLAEDRANGGVQYTLTLPAAGADMYRALKLHADTALYGGDRDAFCRIMLSGILHSGVWDKETGTP